MIVHESSSTLVEEPRRAATVRSDACTGRRAVAALPFVVPWEYFSNFCGLCAFPRTGPGYVRTWPVTEPAQRMWMPDDRRKTLRDRLPTARPAQILRDSCRAHGQRRGLALGQLRCGGWPHRSLWAGEDQEGQQAGGRALRHQRGALAPVGLINSWRQRGDASVASPLSGAGHLAETSGVEIVERLGDFHLAVHHQRSVADDGFVDRLAAEPQHTSILQGLDLHMLPLA